MSEEPTWERDLSLILEATRFSNAQPNLTKALEVKEGVARLRAVLTQHEEALRRIAEESPGAWSSRFARAALEAQA